MDITYALSKELKREAHLTKVNKHLLRSYYVPLDCEFFKSRDSHPFLYPWLSRVPSIQQLLSIYWPTGCQHYYLSIPSKSTMKEILLIKIVIKMI